MIFEKAVSTDINRLTELRIAYLREDMGKLSEDDINKLKKGLPNYFERNLNNDLIAYVARSEEEIVACAFLLITEKPMSPSFITGLTGTVLNVYTKVEHRHKGYARKLMEMLISDAQKRKLSVIELKATEAGYNLYKSVGFKDAISKYHSMSLYLKSDM